jgi:hypothetical protein
VSSGIGSASTVAVAVEGGHHRRGRGAGLDRQRQAVERLEDRRLRQRQVEAQLGLAVDPAPEVDGVVEQRAPEREQV